MEYFYAVTNTQKLKKIKTAKMQKLEDLEEDNTFNFISIKSQHFLFPTAAKCVSTIFYYRSTFKRYPVTLQQGFPPNKRNSLKFFLK